MKAQQQRNKCDCKQAESSVRLTDLGKLNLVKIYAEGQTLLYEWLGLNHA